MPASQFKSLLALPTTGFFFARAALAEHTTPEYLHAIYLKAMDRYDQAVAAKGSFVPVISYIDRSEAMDCSALRMSISRADGEGALTERTHVDLDVMANPEGYGYVLTLSPAMHNEEPIAA